MRIVSTLFALAACAASFSGMAADVQKWTDADGRVHYGDRPPPGVATKEVRKPSATGTPPGRDVRVEESVIRPFAVSGRTVGELGSSMQRTAPVNPVNGQRVWGYCYWNIGWEFKHASEAGACRIDRMVLKVNAVIDFPNWTDRSAAPESLQRTWDGFARALRAHEDGHKENGVRAANDLANRLRALPAEKDCETLNTKITALRERIIQEYRYLDQAFDRATNNGVSQGARLW